MQAVIDQVIAAVEFLFLFTLVAGILVCTQRSLRAVMSACGKRDCCERWAHRDASYRVRKLPRCCSSVVLPGCLLPSAQVRSPGRWPSMAFEFSTVFSPWVFLGGIVGGAAAALIGGWFGLRGVLRTPPLATLREA